MQLPEVATSEKNRQKSEGFPSEIHQLPEGFPSRSYNFQKVQKRIFCKRRKKDAHFVVCNCY